MAVKDKSSRQLESHRIPHTNDDYLQATTIQHDRPEVVRQMLFEHFAHFKELITCMRWSARRLLQCLSAHATNASLHDVPRNMFVHRRVTDVKLRTQNTLG